jgi:hypothetical protein
MLNFDSPDFFAMKRTSITLLIQFCLLTIAYGQITSIDFPYSYTVIGQSGYKERFTAELYDESEKVKVVLEGLEDSLQTSVRRLTSSYDQYQYLIFDNFYYEAGQIKNEVNVQSVYFDSERKQSGDWGLISKNRLSNGNILVVASIHHVSQSMTFIYRFLIFNKTGKRLIARKDYCFLEEPKILPEINGGFSVVIGKDYSPILIENYVLAGNAQVESFANVYRQSFPAISITRFDNIAKVVKKNSYLIHNDPNIQRDKILDVVNDIKYNYVLVISNISGVVNEPTLAALVVQRDVPSNFQIENLYEVNPNRADDKTRLWKLKGKVYASLSSSDEGVEIKSHPKANDELRTTDDAKVDVIEPPTKNAAETSRDVGQKILKQYGIENNVISYIQTPNGDYITTITEESKTLNYFYDKKSVKEVESFKNYIIRGYISAKNVLILGDANSKFSDVYSSTVWSFNLGSKQLKLCANYGINGYTGIYGIRINGNSITCTVNKKRKNEVGSDLVEETISIE